MKWHFRPLAIGEKTRDSIIGEFFSTDAISNPVHALVREGIQNTLDAATDRNVRVRIYLGNNRHALPADKSTRWLDGAWEHFFAPGSGLREPLEKEEPCPFLVFEDFGTTGLSGDPEQAFEDPMHDNAFFYFFRAEALSSKIETARGRWGVGKNVFPRASRLNTYFGLTIRQGDNGPLLMGQTILKSRRLNGTHFSPDGIFGNRRDDGLVLPIKNPETLRTFSDDFKLARNDEPGLSIVVPGLESTFTMDQLKEAVVRDYFYPIMTGTLVVEIETASEKIVVDADTLDEVALELEGDVSDEVLPLVDLGEWAAFRPEKDFFKLNACETSRPSWSDRLIPENDLEAIREAFDRGEKLALRSFLTVREKGKPDQSSHFNFFVWQDGNESGRPLFIREGLVISDVRAPRTRGVRSMVVIEDKPIATLLGDSENPAHTQWQNDSSHFKGKYVYGKSYLDFVSRIVGSFVHAIRAVESKPDPTLLIDFFYLPVPEPEHPRPEPRPKPKPDPGPVSPDEPDPVEPRQKRYRLHKVKAGFAVGPGDALFSTPAEMTVKMAYDLRIKKSLTKYHTADFRVDRTPIRFDPPPRGGTITEKHDNVVKMTISEPDFRLSVVGFDENRDLIVNVDLKESEDDSQI